MLTLLLALLCAGPVPARLGAAQVEARPVSGPAGLTVPWAGLRSPSFGPMAAPALAGPSLSPAALTPALRLAAPAVALQPLAGAPQAVPAAPVVPAAPALAGLEGWYAQVSRKAPPDAPALAQLWDGSGLKTSAAPADAVSPVPAAGDVPGLVDVAG